MQNKIHSKVALVTGGSRGIGKAICFELSNAGYDIFFTYKSNKKKAEETQNLIIKNNRKCIVFKADISKREDVKSMFNYALENFNEINLLVNNAGTLEQKHFEEIKDREWSYVMSTNLHGVFMTTQEISKIMPRGSSIINISSIGGQIGGDKAVHYAASKGGLITLTKSTARVLASKGITVNAISPGFIRTDMYNHIIDINQMKEEDIIKNIPIKRLGEPEDISAAVVFLASPKASYITGQTLNINGGLLMP